jgi:carboxypeptidase T
MRRRSDRRLAVLVAAALVVVCTAASAAQPERVHIQARVEFDSMAEMEEFMALSHFDVMEVKPGVGVTIVTDPEELQQIQALGYDVTVELPDMEAEYASRVRGRDYGDFHEFAEVLQYLDDLHAAYPSITTERFSIGTTYEGRNLWAMKISDNPEVDEPEPEVLYDGIHHAREIIVPEVIMHYMSWLCDNYGTDPEATFLVDEREIWFIVIVNPDGFVYNETHNPNGGGMWRQNRQLHPGGCYGTDVNRNYSYMWGTSGVSHDPCDDETYCGPNAFSEFETQAYKAFAESREFVTNVTIHSVVGAVLIPWSYDAGIHTPDDALFREIADAMTQYNGYDVGQCGEVLWYSCSGTTSDWLYSELGVVSFCIEVGGSGFWPQESEIPGLRAENLWPQQYMTRVAGTYLGMEDYLLNDGPTGDGKLDAGETIDLSMTIQNQGLSGSASNVVLTLVTDDPYVQLHDASSSLGTIAARASATNSGDPFSFTIDPSTPDAHGIKLTVKIEADGFSTVEEIAAMVGTAAVLFSDDMEGGTGNWVENDGIWGQTVLRSHSPTHSYADSPTGSYGNYLNTWIELAQPLDLSHATAAALSFWHRDITEESYDFCYVEASSDGGSTWLQVGPRYHGDNGTWQMVTLPLDEFTGTAYFKVRFRFTSDTYVTDDGWFVDDVVISGPPTGNTAPTAPGLVGPPNGGSVGTSMPVLTVSNATDADPGDVLNYGFLIYGDELCTSVVASASGVVEGTDETSWTVDSPLTDGTYWWRSYADDGTERGLLMSTASFIVQATGIDDGAITRLALHPGRPNPFSGESHLSFDLPARTDVKFAIYGVDGRLVRTLVAGEAGPGTVTVAWDGTDESGRRVGSGLYFMKLEAGSEVRHGKIIRLK